MQHRPDFSEHLPATTSTKLCGRSREKRQFYQKSQLRTNGNLSLIRSMLLLRLFLSAGPAGWARQRTYPASAGCYRCYKTTLGSAVTAGRGVGNAYGANSGG